MTAKTPATAPIKSPSGRALPPPDSGRGLMAVGLGTIFIFFGVLGGWASVARLDSAVVANAVGKVDGNRKSVHHHDGGTVKTIAVREGDHVAQGDVLLTLDDSSLRAAVAGLDQQYVLLAATEARLEAESSGATIVAFPAQLTARAAEPSVRSALAGQTLEFANRRAAIEGQRQVLDQRIAQLQQSITGTTVQKQAYQEQLDSVTTERTSLTGLLQKGLITNDRVLELDRTLSGIRGQIGQAQADIAQANAAIDEDHAQIAQLDKDRASEVSSSLRDTQSKLLDVAPRLQSAQDALQATTVRATYTGTIVGLAVFSVGNVVTPGERILDIVPDETPLTVEAQIPVTNISDVHPGLKAEVHLTAYDQRVLPIIHGTVTSVSADRLTDDRTGFAYFAASVQIDPADLAASPNVTLYPGMPATVMIPTGSRTALAYFISPLADSFDQAFRQK